MKNFELIADAIQLMKNGSIEIAEARLKQFTLLNTPKPKTASKLKIYDWCNPDSIHDFCHGVYHDAANKVAVATDTYALLISADDYVEPLKAEIVVIDKKGDSHSCRYPDYMKLFSKYVVDYDVSRQKVAEALQKMNADKKVNKNIHYIAFNVGSKEKPLYLIPRLCKLLLSLPTDGRFYVSEQYYSSRSLSYESNDGKIKALLMPCSVSADQIGMDVIIE